MCYRMGSHQIFFNGFEQSEKKVCGIDPNNFSCSISFALFFLPILFSRWCRGSCLIWLPAMTTMYFMCLNIVCACDNRAERIHEVTSSVKWLEIKVYRNKTENWSASCSCGVVCVCPFPSLFFSFGHILCAKRQTIRRLHTSRAAAQSTFYTRYVATNNNKNSTGTVKCRPKIDLTENWIKK